MFIQGVTCSLCVSQHVADRLQAESSAPSSIWGFTKGRHPENGPPNSRIPL